MNHFGVIGGAVGDVTEAVAVFGVLGAITGAAVGVDFFPFANLAATAAALTPLPLPAAARVSVEVSETGTTAGW